MSALGGLLGLLGAREGSWGLLYALRGLGGFEGSLGRILGAFGGILGESWAINDALVRGEGGSWGYLGAFRGFLKVLGVLGARNASSACK